MIETQRLQLCVADPAHSEEFARQANDPEIAKYTIRVPYPYSVKAAREFLTSARDRFGQDIVDFILYEKSTNRIVGIISATSIQDWYRAGVGYWVGKEFRGRGYCTEALEKMLKYLFEHQGVYKASASHMATNPASGRVMEKAGMFKEAMLAGHYCVNGKPVDGIIYSAFANIWRK